MAKTANRWFKSHFVRQSQVGTMVSGLPVGACCASMAGIVRLMTVAARSATATASGGNRTGPEIAQRRDLGQHFGATLL